MRCLASLVVLFIVFPNTVRRRFWGNNPGWNGYLTGIRLAITYTMLPKGFISVGFYVFISSSTCLWIYRQLF